ncbi:PRTRC system protein B [Sphingomonas oryzagri]
MADHSTQFEATDGGMVLTNAILLYRTETPRHRAPRPDEPAFASVHGIEEDADGRPTIAAGAPLTREHLWQWTEALGRTTLPEILPANVLVAHPDILAWWIPEQVRAAFFALSSPPDRIQMLSGRTIVPVPYPAHLFVATRSNLDVYALPASQRPDADTRLLHSPILNVYADGRLCWGNIPKPKALTIAAIPEYERAVFDSWSTHPNVGQDLTVSGKGGLVRLWDDLAARKARRFPVKRLKPFGASAQRQIRRNAKAADAEPMTLGKAIATRGVRR